MPREWTPTDWWDGTDFEYTVRFRYKEALGGEVKSYTFGNEPAARRCYDRVTTGAWGRMVDLVYLERRPDVASEIVEEWKADA